MSADTFYVFTTAGIMFGLLFGKKRLTRNSSVATMFFSLILLAFHPVLWWVYIIGLVIGAVGYTLYHLNQLQKWSPLGGYFCAKTNFPASFFLAMIEGASLELGKEEWLLQELFC